MTTSIKNGRRIGWRPTKNKKNGRRSQKKMKMEEELKNNKNGRRPQKNKN